MSQLAAASAPQPRKPSSARRIAASRANGKPSHGPKTAHGLCRSAVNNRSHGLASAQFALLPNESEADFLHVRQTILDGYHPQNDYQLPSPNN